jgi:hypothetical protein
MVNNSQVPRIFGGRIKKAHFNGDGVLFTAASEPWKQALLEELNRTTKYAGPVALFTPYVSGCLPFSRFDPGRADHFLNSLIPLAIQSIKTLGIRLTG